MFAGFTVRGSRSIMKDGVDGFIGRVLEWSGDE